MRVTLATGIVNIIHFAKKGLRKTTVKYLFSAKNISRIHKRSELPLNVKSKLNNASKYFTITTKSSTLSTKYVTVFLMFVFIADVVSKLIFPLSKEEY